MCKVQNNDFSNAKFEKSTAVNNTNANINYQKNLFIFRNEEIDKIKKEVFHLRLKLIPFVSKLLIGLNIVLLLIALFAFKILLTDSFYQLILSSFVALLISVVYYYFNKTYYKEHEDEEDEISESDSFTVLAIVDIIGFSSLFWVYT